MALLKVRLKALVVMSLGWTTCVGLAQSTCMFNTSSSSALTSGDSPYDSLAISPDGGHLLTTSVNETAEDYVLNSFTIDSTTGGLEIPTDQTRVVTAHTPVDGAKTYPAPLCTSRNGEHVYVVYPVTNIIRTYGLTDNDWVTSSSASLFDSTVDEVLFVGMSNDDTVLVVVMEASIQRYTRNITTGALTQSDQTTDTAPYNVIKAATSDSSGDWLVAVSDVNVVVINIADTDSAWSVHQEISTTGPTRVDTAQHVVMAPDDSTVYFADEEKHRIVWLPVEDVDGVPTVTDAPTKVTSDSVSFLAVHPNGKYLYALSAPGLELRSYERDTTTGALTLDCTGTTPVADSLSSMAVTNNGRYVYVAYVNAAGSISVFDAPTEPTPAPTPGLPTPTPLTPPPTPTPTIAPTVAPTSDPTPAPTLAPTVAPVALAPTVNPEGPLFVSAVLSDTGYSFTMTFDGTCYCDGGGTVPSVACDGHDSGCVIGSLLDNATREATGNSTTCTWMSGSSEVAVHYAPRTTTTWPGGVKVALAGGYIHGDLVSTTGRVPYTTGTVVIEERTPAPKLLEAQFSDDGTVIKLSFSSDGSPSCGLLDAANSTSGTGPGACTSILDIASVEMLGKGATCKWTGDYELDIALGRAASAVPDMSPSTACSSNSSITLLDGGVRTEAFALLSSEGCTPILIPDNPAQARAVLAAPQEVGLCGEVTFDGRMSSGGASRDLSSAWSISVDESTSTAALATAYAAMKQFNGSLLATLNVTALEVDVTFTVSLDVENFLGTSDDTAASVVRRDEDIPSVSVLGSPKKTTKRSRSISLRMVAASGACSGDSSLTYTWAEKGGSSYDELGIETFETLVGSDPTALTIPEYTLGYPGSTYLFSGVVTSQAVKLNSSTLVEVVVDQGAVRAVISGGGYRQHTAGGDIELDGGESTDEDDIEELPLRYEWSCVKNCSGVSDAYTSDDNQTFTVPASNLDSGVVYQFSLNVSKGSDDAGEVYARSRSDVATVTVEVVSFEAPGVVVWAKDDGIKSDPTERLVLYGGVAEQSSAYELLWTQESGDLATDVQGWSTYFSTLQTGSNLVVRPGVLTSGSTYVFRLSATDTLSKTTGFAELSVLVNSAPYGGHVEAYPREGTAALDSFLLESLEWTDEVDDLPMMFSFYYANGQDSIAPLFSLSMVPVESPEWQGVLPMGQSAYNFTVSVVGQVSDSLGAETWSYGDANGDAVNVRISGWTESSDTAFVDTMSDIFVEASEAAEETPGGMTSTVRAFASVLIGRLNSTDSLSADLDAVQNLAGVMVEAVTGDYESMDYSTESAGAVLETFVVLSSEPNALGSDSQDIVISASSTVLMDAASAGYWDTSISTPTLQILDQVIGAYDSGGGVIAVEDMSSSVAAELPTIVETILTLTKTGLEDGEEASSYASDYVAVSCLVTSDSGGMSVSAGTSSVSFSEGAVDTSARRRLSTISGGGRGWERKLIHKQSRVPHRRLNAVETSTTSSISVASVQFNINGAPSTEVEGGMTSVRLASTDDGSDIILAAPVTITMRASVASPSNTPSCSYYNATTSGWEADGLVIGAVLGQTTERSTAADIDVSCISYHLSDFAVSTDGVEHVFEPVELTVGFEIFAEERDISMMGMVLTLAILLLLATLWAKARYFNRSNVSEHVVQGKIIDRYIKTGEAKRPLTLVAMGRSKIRIGHRHLKKRRRRISARQQLAQSFVETARAWYDRARELVLQVVQNHPWTGVVAPSFCNLPLTPPQLSLLIFAQVMVQMAVEAAFTSNNTSIKIKVVHLSVGSAATIPASILLPYLFESATTPPRSITAESKWLRIAASAKGEKEKREEREGTAALAGGSTLRTASDDPFLQGQVSKHRARDNPVVALFQVLGSSARSDHGARIIWKTHNSLARGQRLVLVGVFHMVLDIVGLALSAAVAGDTILYKALVTSSSMNLVLSVIILDAVLAARGTSFSLLNFKTVFMLVFARTCVTLLQTVFAFHDMGGREASTEQHLEMGIFVLTLVKIVATYAGEILPCMDAINKNAVDQLSLAKRYRRTSARASMSKTANQTGNVANMEFRAISERDAAAVRIQSFVRAVQARKRILRKKEILLWHRPEVCQLRRKLTIQAYAWLGIYTGTVVWINLCYVFAYDTPTVWSWVTATAITIAIDVVLRKPIGVLAQALIQTIRHEVCLPEGLYIGKGRNRMSV